MATEEDMRRQKQQALRFLEGTPGTKQVEKPPGIDMSGLVAAKLEVRTVVSRQEAVAKQVYNSAMAGFMSTTAGLEAAMKNSELLRLYQQTQG